MRDAEGLGAEEGRGDCSRLFDTMCDVEVWGGFDFGVEVRDGWLQLIYAMVLWWG